MRGYVVVAGLVAPECEAEADEIFEMLADIGATCERSGDNLSVRYEATGNVDAVAHTLTLLREFENIGLETGHLTIEAAHG